MSALKLKWTTLLICFLFFFLTDQHIKLYPFKFLSLTGTTEPQTNTLKQDRNDENSILNRYLVFKIIRLQFNRLRNPCVVTGCTVTHYSALKGLFYKPAQ